MTPQLHTELWTSWASLLRSYAGAHGLSATHHAVTEVGADEILLRVDNRVLRFTPTEATLPNAPAVPFALNEDGTATLDGQTEEMDLLAERLAREMMQPRVLARPFIPRTRRPPATLPHTRRAFPLEPLPGRCHTIHAAHMAAIATTIFSPELAARFDHLATIYPLKRSALVPMLLYAQDEVGFVSDAVVAELAERLDLAVLDVRNVLSYYSMLRTVPAGKYNVQVCTNISCMLRGGYEILDHCKAKSSASATKASPPTASSRSRKSSASAPAAGRPPCRSTTTSTTTSPPSRSTPSSRTTPRVAERT